jgi:hypothetical protein
MQKIVKYKILHWDFLYVNCLKKKFYKLCNSRFCLKYPGVRVQPPQRFGICEKSAFNWVFLVGHEARGFQTYIAFDPL